MSEHKVYVAVKYEIMCSSFMCTYGHLITNPCLCMRARAGCAAPGESLWRVAVRAISLNLNIPPCKFLILVLFHWTHSFENTVLSNYFLQIIIFPMYESRIRIFSEQFLSLVE